MAHRDGDSGSSSISSRLRSIPTYLFHPTTYAGYFHPASYAIVDLCSPFVLDQGALENRFNANGSIQYYDEPREVEINPPEGDGPHDETITTRVGTYSIRQPFFGVLEAATLRGSHPIPLDRHNDVILEAVVSPEVLTLNLGYSLRDGLRGLVPGGAKRGSGRNQESSESIESAVLLFNRWNRGYFHWTTETLTRLEGVERYRERTGEKPKLVVGPNPTQFQRESLALLGYEDDDLIRWARRKAHVERLVVPSVRRELNPGETSPVAWRWLQDRMQRAAVGENATESSRQSNLVYITREDADYRRIANEDEVLELLERYGFETYALSERSMAADVSLIAQADVVVAPHGAGLTNVIYSEDTTVVELFRSNYVQPVYFVLSKQLGHRYRYLLCDYEETDIIVDVAELESVLADELDRADAASPRPSEDGRVGK
jgi:hypothetical protein